MFKNLTLKFKLIVLLVIPFLLVLGITSTAIVTTKKVAEEINTTLSEESFQSISYILNADRDFYQAFVALQTLAHDANANEKSAIAAYEENAQQVYDRVNKAKGVLNHNLQKWGKYTHEDSKRTVFTEFEDFEKNYQKWKDAASKVKADHRKFSVQEELFDVARSNLNVITEIIENGTKQEVLIIEKNQKNIFIMIASVSLAVFVLLFVISGIIIKGIIAKINELTDISLAFANNDFTVKVPDDMSNTEFGKLYRSFAQFAKNLRDLLLQVAESAEDVSASSEEMSASAEQTAQGAQQVAQSVNQLAQGSNEQSYQINTSVNSLNEMNNSIKSILDNAQKGVDSTTTASKRLKESTVESDRATTVINELGDLGITIGEITEIIKSIANQTNLLALNAAIEAARAGEHGKGFAVVAEEVKSLAGESAEATDKITDIIKEIQLKTREAVEVMHKTSDSIASSVEISQTVNEQSVYISDESQILSSKADEILRTMENIAAIIEQSSASAEEISSISEEQSAGTEEISANAQSLAKVADNLQTQLSQFTL